MATSNFFVVAFDQTRTDVNVEALSRYLDESIHILRVWRYSSIPNLVFVRSFLTATELRERLDPFIRVNFIVVPAMPNDMEGRLTSDAWTAFRNDPASAIPALPGPPAPPLPAQGLLSDDFASQLAKMFPPLPGQKR